MYAPTPHDVWDKYLDCYGLNEVFPVAKTAIGNLAAIASDEILFPELARCFMMRGAEVFLHHTSEIYGKERAPKEAAKISRAVENIAYVVSANSAEITNTALPASSTYLYEMIQISACSNYRARTWQWFSSGSKTIKYFNGL